MVDASQVLIELHTDGQWQDHSDSVFAGGAGQIDITRGGSSETDHVQPGSCKLAFYDRDRTGKYSNRVPGSENYRKLGRNTPLRVAVKPHFTTGPLADATDFGSRSAASSWGTSTTGQVWALFGSGGTIAAADWAVTSGTATQSVPAANAYRASWLVGFKAADVTVTATFTVAQATGAALEPAGLMLRGTTISSYVMARVEVTTANAVVLRIYSAAGVELGSATVSGLTHAGTGTPLRMSARAVGRQICAKAWNPAGAEPSSWQLAVTDPAQVVDGWVGIRSGRASGNSNASPVVFSYTNFSAVVELARCVMEVPTWVPRWDASERVVFIPVEAAGILQRLTQGAQALPPASARAITAAGAIQHWPLTDGRDATRGASSIPGGTPLAVLGTPKFAAVAGPVPGESYVQVVEDSTNIGGLSAPVTVSTTAWTIEGGFAAVADDPDDARAVVATWHTNGTYGSLQWAVTCRRTPGVDSNVILAVYWGSTVQSFTTFGVLDGPFFNGTWHHWRASAYQVDPTTISVKWYVDGIEVDDTVLSPHTLGVPVDFAVGAYDNAFILGEIPMHACSSLAVARIAIYDTNTPDSTAAAFFGYLGETAGRRVERLCLEEGISFTAVGNLDDTAAMGPQTPDKLVDLFQHCEDADRGILYETRHEIGISYRTRVSLYNQVAPTIDYSAGLVTPPLDPNEDDRFLWNVVTAGRPEGSEATDRLDVAVDPHHTLTTQLPPSGVGVYDRGKLTIHVRADSQLELVAAWVRHLGTWDELRYPVLTLELASEAWLANQTLTGKVLGLDSGDLLLLDGLPAWLPPDAVALMLRGYSERLGDEPLWTIRQTLTAGWPWEVWQMDTGGSTLAVAVDSDDTSLKLATSAGPEWSTTDEPYHIQIAGEAMTVTAMTTDTPAHIAAGTIAHGVNAGVTPGLPAGMTVDAGQVIIGMAAIRNSGTGVPDLPAGWTNLCLFGNVRIFGKYYVTGDAAPLVTFSGSAANADTSARLFGFSGTSLALDGGRYAATAVSPQSLLNSSAQNIAYPALSVRRDGGVVLLFGWKQDDWTSVATPAAMDAELADNATTTGDDQGIAAYYDIQTTATDLVAGSLVVTGGASAISRAIVLALRPLQTATVTRSVNGATSSIAAGEAVHGWRMGVDAL